jgi:hypothetical protein
MNSFQPSVSQRLNFAVRAFIKRQPLLYRRSLKMRNIDLSYFVNHETDMLLAGFGGSANSYATQALLGGSPGINLAHHLHVAAQVKRAAQLGTPCLVLIRHPVDSISSLTTRRGPEFSVDGLGWALKDYQNYYDAIIGHRKGFITCGFKDVIEDYSAVIRQVNKCFNTNFSVPENGSDALKEIVAKNKVPGTDRGCTLEDVQALMNSPELEKLRIRAEKSYERFCTLTNTTYWKDPDRTPIARRDKLAENSSQTEG